MTKLEYFVKSDRVWSYFGSYFSAFALNSEVYFVNLRIQSECGKIRSRQSLNTDNICKVSYLKLHILGDIWNYMPAILVPSSAKIIWTRILAIAKLSGRKDFILRGFFILFVPPRNYLFKVSYWRTKIRCESCSRLRMKILERFQ